MKVANLTMPLLATVLLSGNAVALAGASSALDPYAYIQAPTRAQREAEAAKKNKKNKEKVKKVAAAVDPEPKGRSIETVPASVVVNERPRTAKKVEPVVAPVKTVEPAKPQTALKTQDEGPQSGEGFIDGLKMSTRALGSSMKNGTKSVGTGFAKIGSGFMAAGAKVKESTVAAGGKVKESGSGMGDKIAGASGKVWDGAQSAGGALMAFPKMIGHGVQKTASKVGDSGDGAKKVVMAPVAGMAALGHGLAKLNPFGGDDAPKAVAQKDTAVKSDASKDSKDAKIAAKPAAKAPVPSKILELEKRDAEAMKAEAKNNQDLKPGIDTSAEKDLNEAAQSVVAEETAAAAAPAKAKAPAPAKVAQGEGGGGFKFGLGMGSAKKLAAAPMAGMSKMGKGFGKLNPFGGKDEKQPAPQATASKLPANAAKPAQSLVPESKNEVAQPEATAADTTADAKTSETESATATASKVVATPPTAEETAAGEIGGRLQPADNNETGSWSAPESTAASPDAIPH